MHSKSNTSKFGSRHLLIVVIMTMLASKFGCVAYICTHSSLNCLHVVATMYYYLHYYAILALMLVFFTADCHFLSDCIILSQKIAHSCISVNNVYTLIHTITHNKSLFLWATDIKPKMPDTR